MVDIYLILLFVSFFVRVSERFPVGFSAFLAMVDACSARRGFTTNLDLIKLLFLFLSLVLFGSFFVYFIISLDF